METASFSSLLRTIVWILFIYYAFKVFFKLFGPTILQSAMKKAGKTMQQQYQNQQQQQQQTQQNYSTPKQDMPHEKKKVGEYIDYEEID